MDSALLISEALKLPVEGRTQLIDLLYESLEGPASAEVHAAQVAELEDRWAAYRRGEFQTLEGEFVMAALRQRYAR